jgi:hypothetical protein
MEDLFSKNKKCHQPIKPKNNSETRREFLMMAMMAAE